MLMFYVPYCRAFDPRLTRNLGDQYSRGVASLSDPICRKVWSAYSPAVDFMTRTEELAQRGLRFQEPVIVPLIVFLAAISYSIWLVIALVLAPIVATHFRQWGRLRFIAAFVVFAFSFNAACCLEVAIINSLEVRRYLTVQMFSTLFAQLLGLWFILEFVVQMCERPMERVFRLAGPGNEP